MATSTTTSTIRAPNTSPSRLWTLHPPSTRVQTMHALLAAYSELAPAALTAHLDTSFTHTVHPSSLGMPTRDLAAFTAHAGHVFKIFSSFAMVPRSVIEDVRRNEVVVFAEMVGSLALEDLSEEMRAYGNECVLQCSMSRDGTKVTAMREFVDSAKAGELRGILEGRMKTGMGMEGTGGEEGAEEGNLLAAAGAMAAVGKAVVVECGAAAVEKETESEKLGFETVDAVLAGHWRE